MSTLDPQEGKATTTVEVEIYGSVYKVRGDDADRLQDLAVLVDGKMRQIAQHVRVVDATKVAVLAALNLAEELAKTRSGRASGGDEISRQRVEGLAGDLERALEAAAP